MPRSKKARPSFEVARADLGETRVGWVYRSDPPAPIDNAPPALVDVAPPPAPARLSTSPPSPRVASPEVSRSWVETGLGVMGLPVALTIAAMMAPMLWLLAPRPGSAPPPRAFR
jgi:hypothetical protein